eukprot:COSAG02_NODE_67833_length_252_cov_0.660131_1_plen_58_part_01
MAQEAVPIELFLQYLSDKANVGYDRAEPLDLTTIAPLMGMRRGWRSLRDLLAGLADNA